MLWMGPNSLNASSSCNFVMPLGNLPTHMVVLHTTVCKTTVKRYAEMELCVWI